MAPHVAALTTSITGRPTTSAQRAKVVAGLGTQPKPMPSHRPGLTEWCSVTQTTTATTIGSASVNARAMRYDRFPPSSAGLRGPSGAGLMARSVATLPDGAGVACMRAPFGRSQFTRSGKPTTNHPRSASP